MDWSIIGSVSNAIAAICAVVAIVNTILNFKSDRQEQKKEKLSLKLRELYKQLIIDSMLKKEDEKLKNINNKLYKMSTMTFDENMMKELYEDIEPGMHDCLLEAEMIKLFNTDVYQKVKKSTENIFDTYGKIINKSLKSKFISKSFEHQIKMEWMKLRESVYDCYVKENFDKLDK